MNHKTIWKEGIKPLSLSSQEKKDEKVDILIIGGGIAGITALYQLSNTKKNILLIDKGRIGFGVTANTTGKITYLQDEIYEQIEKMHDFETARKYLRSQQAMCQKIKEIVETENIDCDFMEVDSYVFGSDEKQIEKIEYLENFLKRCEVGVEISDKLPLTIPCTKALKVKNTAVFHPLKYIYGLANITLSRGMRIYEKTSAYDIDQDGENYYVHTSHGTIEAKQILVCTHYPFFVKPAFVPFKTHVESSYVVASNTDEVLPFSAITITKPVWSIRYHMNKEKYLIFASESDKITKCKSANKSYEAVETQFSKLFPYHIEYFWTTHDVMPNDYLPLIGPVSDENTNLMIATGFQKWGMTNGTLAGILLVDLVLGKENEYSELLKPYRNYSVKRILNTVVDGADTSMAMIKSMVKKQSEHVQVKYQDGKRIGIYIDDKGKEHCVHTVCPHMKCHLIFNEKECTWDCPCHGSRFDIDGNVLEGPSVFNIHIANKK